MGDVSSKCEWLRKCFWSIECWLSSSIFNTFRPSSPEVMGDIPVWIASKNASHSALSGSFQMELIST